MKGSAALLVVFLAALAVAGALAEPAAAAAANECVDVDRKVAPCLAYLTGEQPSPPQSCCDGVRSIKDSAKSPDDRRRSCNCMKQAAKRFSNIKDEFVTKLPDKCSVQLPWPINLDFDCSKIQ